METARHNSLRTLLISHFATGLLGILALSTPGICAAAAPTQQFSATAPRLTARFAVADFDGDQRPDFAEVVAGQGDSENALYLVAFQLSGGPRHSLRISGPAGGLEISPIDVNADGYLDVVVTALWTRRPVAVLLNDGRGNFRLSSPALFPRLLDVAKVQLGVRALQTDLLSTALFYSPHDWNLSGPVTRLGTRSVARRYFLGDRGTTLMYLFHHLPSRAPPSDLSQS